MCQAQIEPYNPWVGTASLQFSLENYFFVANNRLLQISPSLHYNFNSLQHEVRMEIPMLSTSYSDDYQGFEKQVGLGDIRFGYRMVPYMKRGSFQSFEAMAVDLAVRVPTGNADLGLGLGEWQYDATLILAFRPAPSVALYPKVNFGFSGKEVNGRGSFAGTVTDPTDPERDFKLQTLLISLPLVLELQAFEGWFLISPLYFNDLNNNFLTWALQAELGKWISPSLAGSLEINQFLAGNQRLTTWVEVQLLWYFNSTATGT